MLTITFRVTVWPKGRWPWPKGRQKDETDLGQKKERYKKMQKKKRQKSSKRKKTFQDLV